MTNEPARDFETRLREHKLELQPRSVETLQVNMGRLCNQTCLHCHVNAGPDKTGEQMSREVVDNCLSILERYSQIANLDITGGAPELNENFRHLVERASALGRKVMVRHNLTVTLDTHPLTSQSMDWLPAFFSENKVEVISSLPYWSSYFTDRQRGGGTFDRSIESMRLLNGIGYGQPGSGLVLDLVYNPAGAFLPSGQQQLESDFRRELKQRHGLDFNRLFAITNMPINRFREMLERRDAFEEYMEKLAGAFNPCAAGGVMCRDIVSVGWDGRLYDCDFNQMMGLQLNNGGPMNVTNFDLAKILQRRIIFGEHCFGCTAGAGSSCTGETS
jgi:radical SAM/Cys-rich protein